MNRWLKVMMCLLLVCASWSLVQVAEAGRGTPAVQVSGVEARLLPYHAQHQLGEILDDVPLVLFEAILSPTAVSSMGVVRRLQNIMGRGTNVSVQNAILNQPFNVLRKVCFIQQQTSPYLPKHASQYYIFALRRIRI